jgi:hypothetical protein
MGVKHANCRQQQELCFGPTITVRVLKQPGSDFANKAGFEATSFGILTKNSGNCVYHNCGVPFDPQRYEKD